MNRYSRNVEFAKPESKFIADDIVPQQTMMLMQLYRENEERVEKAQAKIDEFYKEHTGWSSIIPGATETYYNKSIGAIKPIAEHMSANPDDMTKPQGRSMITNAIRNTDYKGLADLRQSEINAQMHQKQMAELQAQGKYSQLFDDSNPKYHRVVNDDDTVNPYVFEGIIPYVPTTVINDMRFDKLKDSVFGREGNFYKIGVGQDTIDNVINEFADTDFDNPIIRKHMQVEGELRNASNGKGWSYDSRTGKGRTPEDEAAAKQWWVAKMKQDGLRHLRYKLELDPEYELAAKRNGTRGSSTGTQPPEVSLGPTNRFDVMKTSIKAKNDQVLANTLRSHPINTMYGSGNTEADKKLWTSTYTAFNNIAEVANTLSPELKKVFQSYIGDFLETNPKVREVAPNLRKLYDEVVASGIRPKVQNTYGEYNNSLQKAMLTEIKNPDGTVTTVGAKLQEELSKNPENAQKMINSLATITQNYVTSSQNNLNNVISSATSGKLNAGYKGDIFNDISASIAPEQVFDLIGGSDYKSQQVILNGGSSKLKDTEAISFSSPGNIEIAKPNGATPRINNEVTIPEFIHEGGKIKGVKNVDMLDVSVILKVGEGKDYITAGDYTNIATTNSRGKGINILDYIKSQLPKDGSLLYTTGGNAISKDTSDGNQQMYVTGGSVWVSKAQMDTIIDDYIKYLKSIYGSNKETMSRKEILNLLKGKAIDPKRYKFMDEEDDVELYQRRSGNDVIDPTTGKTKIEAKVDKKDFYKLSVNLEYGPSTNPISGYNQISTDAKGTPSALRGLVATEIVPNIMSTGNVSPNYNLGTVWNDLNDEYEATQEALNNKSYGK